MKVSDERLEAMCKASFEGIPQEDAWKWEALSEPRKRARRERMRAALAVLPEPERRPRFQVTQGEWDEVHRLGRESDETRSIQERLNAVLACRPELAEPPPDVWAAIGELRDGVAMTARALAHAEDEKGLYVVSAARRHGLLQLCDALDAARKAGRRG